MEAAEDGLLGGTDILGMFPIPAQVFSAVRGVKQECWVTLTRMYICILVSGVVSICIAV